MPVKFPSFEPFDFQPEDTGSEARYTPELPACNGAVRLRQQLHHPLDHARHPRRTAIHVEVCAKCHPYFTGKLRLMDTAGRVERFRQKYAADKTSEKTPG